ncbi:Ribosome-binding protein 1 [Orchesella cincta]|uniref:Ribosome-binding protein 1 n=1 Tax=Orchesella cincta TaxID=48709 RepID=A0A1D2MLJ1_ORCCI|nr:Ribosome-binding protein 1 [Orchesella cincta]
MRRKVDEESTPPSPRVVKTSGSNTPDNEVQDSPAGTKRARSKPKKPVDELSGVKIEHMIDRIVLSSSEIQNLIDVLLNKQHAGDSEWINKTKSDNSVGALKKQLEVKEKLLQEENSTVNTLNNKLKELRNEFNNERSKFTVVRRNLEENLSKCNMEMQNLQVRFKQVGEISLNEKQELQKQLQRMNIKFKDVQDEYEAIKADYRNYRDAEQTIRSKADTLERESGALKTQCGHLENQLKNAFQSNKEMSNQLMSLQEHVRVMEERKKSDEVMLNNEYRKLQEQNALLISELSSLKLNVTGVENENAQLRNNVNMFENQIKNLDEVNKKYEEARAAEVGLRNVVNEVKGENARLEDTLRNVHERLEQSKGENENLKRELETRKQVNGDAQEQINVQVKGLHDQIHASSSQIDKLNSDVKRLADEVNDKASKNDELRHKNQKLVESLNVTEQSLQSKIEVIEKRDSAEMIRKSAVAKAVKNTLGDDVDLSSEDWMLRVMERVQEKLSAAKTAAPVHENGVADKEVEELKTGQKKLQDEVVHYQGMLKQTENLLSTLQASINVEESKWVAQTSEKDKEIERLRVISTECESLRQTVEEHKTARSELEAKLTALQHTSSDSTDNEQLIKSNELLKGELESARQRCEDLSAELSQQKGSAPAVNGTTNDECPNNEVKSQVSSPPSPNISVKNEGESPSSPAASSSPPAPTKEKKKKTKFFSKLLS